MSPIPNTWWSSGIAGLVCVGLLPVAAHWIRGDREARCAWDGLALERIYVVRIIEGPESVFSFCCVRCAEQWLSQRRNMSVTILVTDEASGEEIEASAAHYVRSTVVTNSVTGNRCHVFGNVQDAQKHAKAASGQLLTTTKQPFREAGPFHKEDVPDDQ